jgi:preprotein translocase subunit SecA
MSSLTLLAAEADDLAPGRPYVERRDARPPWYDRAAAWLGQSVRQPVKGRTHRCRALCEAVSSDERTLAQLSDQHLLERFRGLRAPLRRRGFANLPVAQAFAIVREASRRAVGQRHHDVQVAAGWLLLQGRLVEMATGEGKTLVATLPACTVALAGVPVHVITVNDYLAARDASAMGPLYEQLGLSVGVIQQGMSADERREMYRRDVTYCSDKELAFDYLRDRAALGERSSRLHRGLDRLLDEGRTREARVVLRGLYFAIVDEADSVFIDDARTPLILSASTQAQAQRNRLEQALEIARALTPVEDYRLDLRERSSRLTDTGRHKLEASAIAGSGASKPEREEWIERALCALQLYHRDRQYVVEGEKVRIVDESTGRVMPDRAWERELHQLIEVKEGCELTHVRETLARMTYQRLFRRYVRLAGMTGTAMEVAGECHRVYGLQTSRVPLLRPSRREHLGIRCFATQAEKWRAVSDAVQRIAIGEGRPVLVGTRSVHASERVSAQLAAAGIDHVVLNAKQDREEAQIVAQAGEAGRVTVATNMAGRGTDIRLAAGIGELGGLHVILTEFNESRRIDRQLYGRCARQGDRGSCEAIVALDDDLFVTHAPGATRWLMRSPNATPPAWATRMLVLIAQAGAERHNRSVRMQHLAQDRRLAHVMAFSGRGE